MTLPEIALDDRRFQDLVNEARLRIHQSCPEWTDHNVSDPGITLVELFAWLTETLIYRLNRVPDKLHVTLLELLGMRLAPPTAATTEILFRLAGPADEPALIPGGTTEIGTPRTPSQESIVFETEIDFEIPPIHPVACAVARDGHVKAISVAAGVAKPQGGDQLPFATPPQVGDALYLGFDESLERLLVKVDVDCSRARGTGVRPEDPPLRWEVSTPDGIDGWLEARVLADRTGGFNYGSGVVELQLPPRHAPADVGGQRAHWLRCRVAPTTMLGIEGAAYTHPPEVYSVTAAAIGAVIPATHARRERAEVIGESDGTPAQTFRLRSAPVLKPAAGETLEICDPDSSEWHPWELRDSFVECASTDRVYRLDLADGVVELGPAIRDRHDGEWVQYGAVPPKGAVLRFTSYRHGGGRTGNVAADTLTTLKSAIPGISSVTNPEPARGGVDGEVLDDVRRRAGMELHTRHRAVTSEDFEFLALQASSAVARAVCVPPANGGVVRVHILPQVNDGDRRLEPAELLPNNALLAEVATYLDERRLIGVSVEVLPVALRAVSVVVNVQASEIADLQRVEEDVMYALYTYLNPLVGGAPDGPGPGWDFGRTLNQGELYGIVHSVDGVDFVKILRLYEADLVTGKQAPKPVASHIALASNELIASAAHLVKAERRGD